MDVISCALGEVEQDDVSDIELVEAAGREVGRHRHMRLCRLRQGGRRLPQITEKKTLKKKSSWNKNNKTIFVAEYWSVSDRRTGRTDERKAV